MSDVRANYGLFCVFVSAFVVLLLDVVRTTPSTAEFDRAVDTTIGVALALVVFRALTSSNETQATQPPASCAPDHPVLGLEK